MFGSVVLDTAIGLALLFLFVSLICAAMREAVEAVLNERAAALDQGVRAMLEDPDGVGLARTVMQHPAVQPLRAGAYRPDALRRPVGGGGPAGGAVRVMPLRERRVLPAYIPSGGFARALLDAVGPVPGDGEPGSGQRASVAAVRTAAARLPAGGVRTVLLDAAERAGDDLERLTAEVERWFDVGMARLGSWYRRRTRLILFALGLGVAGIMNVDAFAVGQALFADKALRDVAVADAERDGGNLDRLKRDLGGIRFPVGWDMPLPQVLRGTGGRVDPGAVLQMLAGWLVTAFAVTMGAPFWFDLLGRFVAVRAAVKPN